MAHNPRYSDDFNLGGPAQTQCPDCRTIFRVTAAQLEAAQGLVRCGECGNIFNGGTALLNEPALETRARQENLDLSFDTPADDRPRARFFLPEVDAATERSPGVTGKALWLSLSVTLAVFLLLQLTYLFRDTLALVPGMRGPLNAFCEFTGCTIAPRRDLQKLALLNRNVYSHPNVPGALIISATIINNATFTQQYPVLAVSMANVRGTTLAQRSFNPQDYLPLADVAAGMTPGAPVSIALQVADPGSDAMTFELDFR
ncbi:MAG: DUF3426 domain-containing protein [Gammaproteobacteria bacterium]|nr:DUF3426 domain-containing protein [Gammaproteobacteria bacterium]